MGSILSAVVLSGSSDTRVYYHAPTGSNRALVGNNPQVIAGPSTAGSFVCASYAEAFQLVDVILVNNDGNFF